jgi:uncharacterized membrane protein YkvA (DUF1232 family)
MGRLVVILIVAAAVYFWARPKWPRELAGRLPRALGILLALLYLVSPVDLIPDVLGPVGFLDDILVLLGVLWWASQQVPRPQPQTDQRAGNQRAQPSAEPEQQEARWDPYAVLGIQRGASREQITRAYRKQMKRYHPDRVAGLGEELQRVAHEKTVEIQRAYAELK